VFSKIQTHINSYSNFNFLNSSTFSYFRSQIKDKTMAKRKHQPSSKPAPTSGSANKQTAKATKAVPKEAKSASGAAGLIIAALAFFLYAPSLRYGYVLDDQMVYVNNQYVQEGFAGIGKILSTESFAGFFGEQKNLLVGGRYRPLSIVTFAIEKGLFGQNAALSHVVNLLLVINHLITPRTKTNF
jgi:hypothetical protein